MEIFSADLLFFVSLVISIVVSFAQQDPNYQKLVGEVETLKGEVSVLQDKLQKVKTAKKIELIEKLAEAEDKRAKAYAKLISTQFSTLKNKLRDFNHGWLMAWNLFFLALLAFIMTGIAVLVALSWSQFKSSVDQQVADEVEKSLNGFKEAVSEVNILAEKIGVLDKEYTARVIEDFMHDSLSNADSHPEEIKGLSEEALLDVFRDGMRNMDIKIRILEILVHRGSTQVVSPTFELLNSILDLYKEKELKSDTIISLHKLINLLGYTSTEETYEGLTKFLGRLVLREDTERMDFLLAATVSLCAGVGHELNKRNWISLLKTSFSHLDNEPETIRGILDHLPDEMPSVDIFKEYLLELLE